MTHNQDSFLIELKTPLTVPSRAWVIAASAAVLGDAQHNPLQNQGPPAPGKSPAREGQGTAREEFGHLHCFPEASSAHTKKCNLILK